VLEAEHRYIQKVVGVVALHADALESGTPPDLDLLSRVVEFIREYADRLHHGKEETLLFPALEQGGVPPQGCPLGILKHEHTAGRALVAELAGAVDGLRAGGEVALGPLVKCLQGLVELYPGHIWKEDYLLFPMTGKVLAADAQSELAAEFEKVDQDFGIDRIHGFEAWADASAASAVGG
jgi:hemerythrin-like domain-containing protein